MAFTTRVIAKENPFLSIREGDKFYVNPILETPTKFGDVTYGKFMLKVGLYISQDGESFHSCVSEEDLNKYFEII